ncbi:hypothetical protein [Edaphobacter modestus]|uniref:Uncharacterized protein n=1 Tax=Edaphobacter modestus TaxID=388466 RepID=A0A4Q7YXK3_9BACT|nr:hypothetical protein [Edaphobacter modestus]RZU41941.1 hypothetical protein BDD14_3483 [Edaphobacter modestus]
MKHLNEEQLINYYYGESEAAAAIDTHLRECRDCAKEYAALTNDLSAIAPSPTPIRDADYGAQVWQSIRSSVPVYEAPRKRHSWFALHPMLNSWSSGLAVAAACVLIAAAFFAGRQWEHRNGPSPIANNGSGDQGRQRVVLVVLSDHLDRSERLLVELKHAGPSTESPLRAEARDLLSANRLYRESVKQAGDPALSSALDHLERVLIEVSNEPAGLSQAKLDELQKEMNTDGLLFEVRVLRSRVQEDVDQKGNTAAAGKGVSIL